MIESLTPAQRLVYDAVVAPGAAVRHGSRADIARRLGMTVNTMSVLAAKVRLKLGLRRRGTRSKPAERRVLGECRPDVEETPREARARVRRELAAGKRCRACWLLLPCDHEHARAA